MYMHLDMVISDIRGHTQVEGYSEYHHAINGYWVADNLGDSWSTSRVIGPVTEITKVTRITQACTLKRVHNEPLKIPNNNLDEI